MEHTTIAVDLAKSVFQVAVSHRPGHLDEERRLSRDRLVPFFAAAGDDRARGLRVRAPLGPPAPTLRSYRTAAAST